MTNRDVRHLNDRLTPTGTLFRHTFWEQHHCRSHFDTRHSTTNLGTPSNPQFLSETSFGSSSSCLNRAKQHLRSTNFNKNHFCSTSNFARDHRSCRYTSTKKGEEIYIGVSLDTQNKEKTRPAESQNPQKEENNKREKGRQHSREG